MRKNILFFILLFFFFGCKEQEFEPDYSSGKAVALKNGEEWIGKARGTVHQKGNGINMYYDVFNPEGILRQRLSFNKIPLEIGNTLLYNTFSQTDDSLSGCRFNTVAFDGDVKEDVYLIKEDENYSLISVDSYNPTTRWLRGTFKASFFIDPSRTKANPANPDSILFEMGEFEVKIE